MEIIAKATPDEIAALVRALQGRQDAKLKIDVTSDTIFQSVSEAIHGTRSKEQPEP